MKRVLGLCLTVGVFTLAIETRVEAIPSITLRVCQGLTCVTLGPGVLLLTADFISVGDYQVSTSGASAESAALSNSHTTSIQVRRVTSNSVGPLEVWLSVSGYLLPIGPEHSFFTTIAATSSGNVDPVDVTYQGWYSPTNSGLIPGPPTAPPADGITAGPVNCAINGGNLRRPGSTACSALPPGLVNVANPNALFSLVTRITFNILTPSTEATYGATAQANVTQVQ